MKKYFLLTILIFVFSFAFPAYSFAQGMMGDNMMGSNDTTIQNDSGHTVSGEAEGKTILEKLQTQELDCENLSDDDFHALGMYFMGLVAGDSHEAMDTMMAQMMGEDGENQMHIAMGKRMSNCEPNAPMPQGMMNGGMMQMMMGGGMMGGGGNSMMGNFATNPSSWFSWGFGWIFMILFWGFIILGIIALIKWIMNQGKHEVRSKSALEVLKERYAKGEIDKKEFEDKKKDLS